MGDKDMNVRDNNYTKKEMAAHNGVDTRFWGNKLPKLENIPEGWDDHMHTQQLCRKPLDLSTLKVEYRNGFLVCYFDVSEEEYNFLKLKIVRVLEKVGYDGDVPICKETGELAIESVWSPDNSRIDFINLEDENAVTITHYAFGLAITKYFMREPRKESIPVYTEAEFDYLSSGAGGYRHFNCGTFGIQAAIIIKKDSLLCPKIITEL